MRRAVCLIAIATAATACGRLGFDARGDDAGSGDATDGNGSADGDGAMPRAPAYVRAAISDPDDLFGCSVAISADGTTLAIGAYGEAGSGIGAGGDPNDNAMPGAGAVYIFVRGPGGWTQQAYLKASNTNQADVFGVRVALARDGNTLAVTAPDEDSTTRMIDGNGGDNSADSAGAAYVFTRSGTQWMQQAYLKAANTDAGDNFGNAIAISASGDRIAVGAFTEDSASANPADNSALDAGAVYVFSRTATVWTQDGYLKASNADPNDSFGADVAISDDGEVIAVSATSEASGTSGVGGDPLDNSQVQAGAVYVFRHTTIWSQEAYIKASNVDAGDFFGNSIALSADGNTLAIAAEGEDGAGKGVDAPQMEGAGQAGAVYIFNRTTAWQQQAYIKATNTEDDDRFGRGVALNAGGDVLLVGAPFEDGGALNLDGDQNDNSASAAGASYTYARSGTAWTPRQYVKATNTETGDQLGNAVALSAGGTIVVGAWNEDGASNGVPNGGAVYVFE